MAAGKTKPSLESLIESEDLGIEVLHPGGLEITRELAELCRIRRGSPVLDVASGTGESACWLAETLGAVVTGIDLSETMVRRATNKAARRNLSIAFRRGDARRLPFGDGTFDAVISECTTSLLDKKQAIREMARVAKPGGYVGIHDISWKEGAPVALKHLLEEVEGERPETLEGWKTLFGNAGLADVVALDRSRVVPAWMKETERALGITGVAKVYLKILKTGGLSGMRQAWRTERIFRSPFMGYGIIVGRKKPDRA